MAGKKPNIIFIMVDELHWKFPSCYGGRGIDTPAMDRLAREGVRMEKAFTVCPICVPSRGAFMSGRHAHVTGCRDNATRLPEHETDMVQVLRDAGYVTCLSGKNHCFRDLPARFDEVLDVMHRGYVSGHEDVPPEALQAAEWIAGSNDPLLAPMGVATNPHPADVCPTAVITDHAISFMESGHEQPFFLWLSYPDPHWPFQAPEPYASMVNPQSIELPPADELGDKPARQRIPYELMGMADAEPEDFQKVIAMALGMTRFIDDQIGRVLDTLQRLGIDEDTLMFFTSDHGDYMGEHGLCMKSVSGYDCLMRIPLIWRWPGHITAGHVAGELCTCLDVLPTVLDLVGIETVPGLHGASLAAALKGQADFPHREAIFAEVGHEGTPASPDLIRDDVMAHPREVAKHWISFPGYWCGRVKIVRTQRYKFVYYREGDMELYDLEADPFELRNLAGDPAHKETLSAFKERLFLWMIDSETELPPVPAKNRLS